MRRNQFWIAFIIFLTIFLPSLAQQNGTDRIIPPSPTAASLGRYGDLQVGYYTGTASINIPIHTLVEGDIKLPINLSGSARAFTVSEIPGWVGAGFNLQAGGVITRSSVGLPDDLYSPTVGGDVGFLYNFSNVLQVKSQLLSNNLSQTLVDRIVSNTLDLQPDVYSYNFNGYAGLLYIDPAGGINAIYSYSHENIEFIPNIVTRSEHGQEKFLDSWTAKTPDGFEYTFEAKEWTRSSSVIGTQSVSFSHISSWYLTSITSPTGHQVTFGYTALNATDWKKRRLQEYYFDKMGKWASCSAGSTTSVSFGTQLNAPQTSETECIYLSEIVSDNTTIKFETSKRNDLYQQYTYATIDPQCNNPADCQEDRKLDKITIKNKNGAIVNEFNFGYYENPSYRLQLTSVTEVGRNPYLFEYNGAIPVTYSSKSIDHWGYYNGSGNTNLIPIIQITNIPDINGTYGYANREPNYNNTKLGSLKKIVYPTRGYNEFEYQQNDYSYINDQSTTVGNKVCGGLRVSKIKTYDNVGNIEMVKEYDYTGSGIVSNGVVGAEHTYQIYLTGINSICQRLFWVQSNSVFPLSYTSGNIVAYRTVTEKLSNGSYTVYDYESFYDYPDGAAVFSFPFVPINSNAEILQFAPKTSMDHMRGKLKRVAHYNNLNQLIKEQISHHIIKTSNAHEQTFFAYTPVANPPIPGYSWPHPVHFPILVGYKLKSQWVVKEYDIEKDYDPLTGSTLTKRTDYTYDNAAHLQLTKAAQTNSNGEIIEKLYRYPGDAIASPTTEEQNATNYFLSSKILNRLLEEETVINGVSAQRKRISYKSFVSQGFPWMHKISQSIYSNPLTVLSTFNAYDNDGNLLEVAEKSGTTKKYIWDYNNSLPIAEVTQGTNTGDIAYTSFEADGWGGWTMNPGSVIIKNTAAITGKNTSSGGVQKLVPAGNYIVSLWSVANGWVNGQLLTQTPTMIRGAWRYYEIKLNNVSSINVAGDNIDEVRLYPQGAQMTTYTYEPLIGITSQCTPDNRITYYEYDEINRLTLIRDDNRNVIKKYCYNYPGQPERCSYFYNEPQSQTFTKQTCGYGYTGSQFTYTVPAGRYFSTLSQQVANQKALDEIAQNGQTYANNQPNGCNPVTIYAVIGAENVWYDGTTEYGDIIVRFYADADFTIPFSVQNLSVNIRDILHGNLCGCDLNNQTYQVNCNGQATVIAGSAILYEEVWGSEVDYRYRYFEVLPGPGYIKGN